MVHIQALNLTFFGPLRAISRSNSPHNDGPEPLDRAQSQAFSVRFRVQVGLEAHHETNKMKGSEAE